MSQNGNEYKTVPLLKLLRDYFPTAVFTGRALVFISEENRVELTEQAQDNFAGGTKQRFIRIRLGKRSPTGVYSSGHQEDFHQSELGELAAEIDKFVFSAVGKPLRELGT